MANKLQAVPLRTALLDSAGKLARTWSLYFESLVTHMSKPLKTGSIVVGNGVGDIISADLSGDATTAGGTAVTLAASGVTPGIYGSAANAAQVTIDAKGRVTLAANVATGAVTSLTGDVTASGPGAAAATLAVSGVTAGTYGDAANVSRVTVDAKGRVTAASAVAITAVVQAAGTFTPVLQFGGASAGITYATQQGDYCRVGNLVIARVYIVLTAKGTSVGAATIAGLPIAASSAIAASFGGAFGYISGMTAIAHPLAYLSNGATTMNLADSQTGTLAALTNANFGNGTIILMSIPYFA